MNRRMLQSWGGGINPPHRQNCNFISYSLETILQKQSIENFSSPLQRAPLEGLEQSRNQANVVKHGCNPKSSSSPVLGFALQLIL